MLRLIFPLLVISVVVFATFFVLSKRERKQDLTIATRWMVSLGAAAGVLLLISIAFYLGDFIHG